MNLPSWDIPNQDLVVPGIVIVISLLIMAITWYVTRPKASAEDLPAPQTIAPPPARIAADELSAWHRRHGNTVQRWIENHERVLRSVSKQGLQVDLMGDSLTSGHDALATPMRDAITSHPAPSMRAQLSALVVSSEATLHALVRSEYQDAERQHLTYLEYRDNWLQRLRQFSQADSEIRHLQTIPGETPPTGNIWLSGDVG